MVPEGYDGVSDDDDAAKTLVHAIEAGMMIDSADAYGGGHNETLIAGL
jgi:aryl-alcohol dehydrogenase-like predicted oxidoreductase